MPEVDRKETVIATMLFADLVNSTEMAKNLTLQEYDDMIVAFQATMFEIVSHHLHYFEYQGSGLDSEWSIVGDELRIFLYSGNVRFDIRNALLVAVKIKLAWLASEFNQKIIKEGRLVSRIGVGINCGKVIRGVRPWRVKMGQEQPNIEGYAINLTKRIESASREGTCYQVMVGDSLQRICKEKSEINVTFSRPHGLTFRGLGQRIPVYEVVSFVNFELLPSLPPEWQERTVAMLEDVVRRPMPEPWVFPVLLRHYISAIATGEEAELETRAIKLANEALEIFEYKAAIYNFLGWLYAYGKSVRNLEMAFHYFDQSLGMDPRNRAALLHRARILDRMGQHDLARLAYQELIALDPSHPEATSKVSQYQAM